jgi:endonuclease-3
LKKPGRAAAAELVSALHWLYPGATAELDYSSPLELLVATILSAQSTDTRVNEITKSLFEKYRNAGDYAEAASGVLEEEIRSSGFYRNKTKSLIGMGKALVEHFDGEPPRTIAELTTLPGVARKTANVVLGTAYGIAEGVVVDTHVRRLSQRLGLSSSDMPTKIEQDLMKVLRQDEWVFAAHALILHGRRICVARKPRCDECELVSLCPQNGVDAP